MFMIRKSICGLVLILVTGYFSVLKAQQSFKGDILLEPLGGKQGEIQLMIFVANQGIEPDAYVDFLKRIQKKTDFPLWISQC